jgi:hypothetical protein
MLKKQFKVVLPRQVQDENSPFHLLLPERALHSLSNQKVYYSHAGTSKYVIPTNQLHKQDIEEYSFSQVLHPDSPNLFKEPLTMNILKTLGLIIFGDNSVVKQTLLGSRTAENCLAKELVNSALRYSSSIEATFVLFSSTCPNISKPKKATIYSYADLITSFNKFSETIGQTDMEAYHLLLTLNFTVKGEIYSVKIIRLISNLSEAELFETVSLQKNNLVVK